MRNTRLPLRTVLNAAFDDTLDYWFLCVPSTVYVLIGAIILPNVVRGIDALPLGSYKTPVGSGLVFVYIVVTVLLNVFANFLTVKAWTERDRGRVALRRAFDTLRNNMWRCAWTYTAWFFVYLAYVTGIYAAIAGVVLVGTLPAPPAVAVPAYIALGGGALYLAWRLLRLIVAVQYLPAVLASTEHGGRRAVGDGIAAMRKRFWLSLVLPFVTYLPGLLPNLIAMRADWRLHSFVACIFGGFFATFGTLVTLYVYRAPREAVVQRAVTEPERAPTATLVGA